MPAAQFSVSKYQLMPQIGTVAATTATTGRPTCRARSTANGTEYRTWRARIDRRRLRASPPGAAYRPSAASSPARPRAGTRLAARAGGSAGAARTEPAG